MRQLSDILEERILKVKGKAALGRILGVSGEAILQYTQGRMPSLQIAIKWKEAFNENLIDLMFEEKTSVVNEPEIEYNSAAVKDKYISALESLNECRQEKEELKAELNELKKILPVGTEPKLKPIK